MPLDLRLRDTLFFGLAWTSESRKGDDERNDWEHIKRTLEAGLNLRYLVVHRVIDMVRPLAVSPTRFNPDYAKLEGVVVDLNEEKIMATYELTAKTPDTVDISYRKDGSPKVSLEEFAWSGSFSDAWSQILEKLEEMTGGTVRID